VSSEIVGLRVNEPIGRELHNVEIDLHPAFQGGWIGKGLVRNCLINARKADFRALTLTTLREAPWN